MTQRIASIFLALIFLSLDCQATIHLILNPNLFVFDVPSSGYQKDFDESPLVNDLRAPKIRVAQGESATLEFAEEQKVLLGFSWSDPVNSPYNDFIHFSVEGESLQPEEVLSIEFVVEGSIPDYPLRMVINDEQHFDINLNDYVSENKVQFQVEAKELRQGKNKIGWHQANTMALNLAGFDIDFAKANDEALLAPVKSKIVKHGLLKRKLKNTGKIEAAGELLRYGSYPSIPKGLQNAMPGAPAFKLEVENIDSNSTFQFHIDGDRVLAMRKELRVFYFDQQSLNWVDFKPDTTFVLGDQLIAEASLPAAGTYFTGFKSSPAGSEGSMSLPTSLGEISAPNPLTGYGSIAAPRINQKGSAATSFPFKIPPGRNGVAPSLAAVYSSDSKSGLLGVGWDVPVSSIDVDLRWGVPRFLSDVESETYTLDGSVLTMEGGFRGNRRDADGNYANRVSQAVLFFPKTQSNWKQIRRYGADPKSYYWVVTTAEQSKLYFGTEDGSSQDPNALVTNDNGDVLSWKLKRIEDKWGNFVEYNYEELTAQSSSQMLNGAKQTLLSSIRYTGFESSSQNIEPPYLVEFKYEDGNRADARTSFRSGANQGSFKLLKEVVISFDPDPQTNGDEQEIRTYHFLHEEGDFGKILLKTIEERVNGNLFYDFDLEYFENPEFSFSENNIVIPSPWSNDPDEYSMLGAADNSGYSIGGLVGGGIILPPAGLGNTVYGGGSYGRAYNYGRSTLKDLNGDGLLDYVIQESGWTALKYYPGRIDDNGNPYFGSEKVTVNQAGDAENNRFHYSYNDISSAFTGVGIYTALLKANGGLSWNWNSSTIKDYTSDFNGDGITDLVDDNRVSFGTVDPISHNVVYKETSYNGPNPIYDDAIVNWSARVPAGSFETEVVRSWRALVDGTVDVTGNIYLKPGSSDGVKYAVEHIDASQQNNVLKSFTSLGSGAQQSVSLNSVEVQSGDLILFRVIGDGNTRFDLLDWNPQVDYQSGAILNADLINVTETSQNEGFILSSPQSVDVSNHSQVQISFPTINCGIQSDTVIYEIHLDAESSNQNIEEVFRYTVLPGNTANITLNDFNWGSYTALKSSGLDLSSYDQATIRFNITSPSNVNWNNLQWLPEVSAKKAGEPNASVYFPTVDHTIFEKAVQLNSSINLQSLLYPGIDRVKFFPTVNNSLESAYYNSVNHTEKRKFRIKIKTTQNLVQTFEIKLDPNTTGIEIRDLNNITTATSCGEDNSLSAVEDFEDFQVFVSAYSDDPVLAEMIPIYTKVDLFQLLPDEEGYVCDIVEYENYLSVYYTDRNLNFGPEYLGWGGFGWNANPQPIDPSKFSIGVNDQGEHLTEEDFEDFDLDDLEQMAADYGFDLDLQTNPFRPLYPVRGDQVNQGYFQPIGTLNSMEQDAYCHPFSPFARILRGSRSLGTFGELPTESFTEFIDPGSSNFDKHAPFLEMSAYNTSYSAGGGLSVTGIPIGASGSYTSTTYEDEDDRGNTVLRSMMDMNGDGFPDEVILNEDLNRLEARLSDCQGGRRSLTTLGYDINIWRNKFTNDGITGSVSLNVVPEKGSKSQFQLALDASVSGLDGTSDFEEGLLDINGDGLPDLIDQSALNDGSSSGTIYKLNNGHGFASSTNQSLPLSNNSMHADSETIALGVGVDPAKLANLDLPIDLGLSYSYSKQGQVTKTHLRDFNGDGLLDIFVRFEGTAPLYNNYRVYLNRGTYFSTDPIEMQVTIANESKSNVVSINAMKTWTVSGIDKIVGGLTGAGFFADSYQVSNFIDVNGDGYPDKVWVDSNNELHISLCTVTKSNLLRKIKAPGGSEIALDYQRVGNKYGYFDRTLKDYQTKPVSEEERVYWDMNYSKWVLTEVRHRDGFDEYFVSASAGENGGGPQGPSPEGINDDGDIVIDDGVDEVVSYYHYDGGIHDRRNREFLGFSRIGVESDKYLTLPNVSGQSWYDSETGGNGVTSSLVKDGNELHYFQIQQFTEPGGGDFSERTKHSYIANLLQTSYNLLLIKEEGSNETYVPANYMMEVRDYQYDFHQWVIDREVEGLALNTVNLEDREFDFQSIGETDCVYPELTSTETYTYADYIKGAGSQRFLARKIEFTYNRLGLLTRIILNGSDGPGLETWEIIGSNDQGNILERAYAPNYKVDLITLLNYYYPQNAANRVGQIERYRLYSGDTISNNSLLRRSKVDQLTPDGLAARKMGADNGNGVYSFTSFFYTPSGQLDYAQLPVNHKGDELEVHMEYDLDYQLYPTKTTKRFILNDGSQWDEESHVYIDPATALMHKSIDPNGQATEVYYDDFYRLERVYGPRELAYTNAPYTLAFEYWDGDINNGSPWAMAKQYLGSPTNASALGANPSSPGIDLSLSAENRDVAGLEPIWSDPDIRRAASVTDGWGRVMQSQQEVSILGPAGENVKGRRVSGPLAFDNFMNLVKVQGAIATNSNPNEEALRKVYLAGFSGRMPAFMSHMDAFGRGALAYSLTDFEWNGSRMYQKSTQEFGWAERPNQNGYYLYGLSKTYGHELMEEKVFYDYFGNAQLLLSGDQNSPAITQYTHDAIGQLLESTNPAGLTTYYEYDLRGRVVQEDQAERGQSQFTYDLVGNLLQSNQSSVNREGESEAYQIDFEYEYDRLQRKIYPVTNKINDLEVIYGRPGQDGNTLGRVRKVKQGQSGAYVLQEQFRYNAMGQISREDRTIAVPQYGNQRLVTDFVFDSWGRLKHMRYPDGERLEYHYAAGGDLNQVETTALFKSSNEPSYYLKGVDYDGFGQPLAKRYGNESQSSFEYDDLSGSLKTYKLYSSAENSAFVSQQLLDKDFTYDATGNISKVENHQSALGLPYNNLGGSYTFDYQYDELNQLVAADGLWQGAQGAEWNYDLDFSYDLNGRVLSKTQIVSDAQQNVHPTANYDFTYRYDDHQRNAPTSIIGQAKSFEFQYDPFGNMDEVKKDGKTELKHLYNEEHRLRGSLSPFEAQHNVYDPYGIRLMKGEMTMTDVYENGEIIGQSRSLQPYLVNAGPHYLFQVFEKTARVSKHYYGARGSRIASRVLSERLVPEGYVAPAPGQDGTPGNGAYFGDFNADAPEDLGSYSPPVENNVVLTEGLAELLRDFDQSEWYEPSMENERPPYPELYYDRDACAWEGMGDQPSTFQVEFCDCINAQLEDNSEGNDCDLFPEIYWYHGDGLGNVEYLTDLAGMPYEYFWYAPSGELIEHQQQGNAGFNTPFQFSARTYDAIPELVYMGARYYSPQFSIFASPDPMRAYRSWISPYNYVQNNPVMRQDPTGMLDGGILEEGVPGEPKNKDDEDTDVGGYSTVESNPLPEVVVTPDGVSEPSSSEVSESDVNLSYQDYQERYPEFQGLSQREAREYWEQKYKQEYEEYWDNSVRKEREQLALRKLKYFLMHIYAGEDLIMYSCGYGAVNAVFRTSSGQILRRSIPVREMKKVLRAKGVDQKLIDEIAEEAAKASKQTFKSIGAAGRSWKNVKKISDNLLKNSGLDAHAIKREFLGRNAKISRYDLYKHTDTGEVLIFRKGGQGEPIFTGYFIN